jgi:hypothetical protein
VAPSTRGCRGRAKSSASRFTLQRARALVVETARDMEDGFAIHRMLKGALEEAGV